jgi:hypothetical protein
MCVQDSPFPFCASCASADCKRTFSDPRLRPRGHWDRPLVYCYLILPYLQAYVSLDTTLIASSNSYPIQHNMILISAIMFGYINKRDASEHFVAIKNESSPPLSCVFNRYKISAITSQTRENSRNATSKKKKKNFLRYIRYPSNKDDTIK